MVLLKRYLCLLFHPWYYWKGRTNVIKVKEEKTCRVFRLGAHVHVKSKTRFCGCSVNSNELTVAVDLLYGCSTQQGTIVRVSDDQRSFCLL